jgi:sporulation-control protein spo0M
VRRIRVVCGGGLNAWLPLFAGALAQRLDLVELQLGANYGIEERDHPG